MYFLLLFLISLNLIGRGKQIYNKSRSHLQIVCVGKMTQGKFDT